MRTLAWVAPNSARPQQRRGLSDDLSGWLGHNDADANEADDTGDLSNAQTGGELEETWEGVMKPSFVAIDLGLTHPQGTYLSGLMFQAVLVEQVMMSRHDQ